MKGSPDRRRAMSAAQPGWQVKGVYHETCASEGHCPYYFGRDKEGGCRYFMVFRITEGQVGGVDLAGVTAVYLGDLPYATYAEVATKGSHGAAYISDTATPHQRAVLDTLAVSALGGALMKDLWGVNYVPLTVEEGEDWVQVSIPTGQMKMQLTRSGNGEPVRIENATLPFLRNIKAAHAPYWRWADYDRHYEYRNRCGTWADFIMGAPSA
jgi:hypothetical protein